MDLLGPYGLVEVDLPGLNHWRLHADQARKSADLRLFSVVPNSVVWSPQSTCSKYLVIKWVCREEGRVCVQQLLSDGHRRYESVRVLLRVSFALTRRDELGRHFRDSRGPR